MAIEIERKFRVRDDEWITFREQNGLQGVRFCQGYLAEGQATVRVRISGTDAWMTVKGRTTGVQRLEFEYPIPVAEARDMLDNLCAKPLIDKYRYRLPCERGLCWEIDEFLGDNAGLIVAEIELPQEDTAFASPAWLGDEVSQDARYFNVNLAKHPFKEW